MKCKAMATAFCLFLCSDIFAADGEDAQISHLKDSAILPGILTLEAAENLFLTEQSACGIPGQRLQKKESSVRGGLGGEK